MGEFGRCVHLRVFTDEVISILAEKHGVRDDFIEEFSTKLRRAEDRWVFNTFGKNLTDISPEENKELTRLARAADNLAQQLDFLSKSAWERLQEVSHVVRMDITSPTIKLNHSYENDNEVVIMVRGSREFPNPADIRLTDLVSALNLLSKCSTLRFSEADAPPRGPKPKLELAQWIKDMYELWTAMGREFTIGFTENLEPLSDAAVFCCDTREKLPVKVSRAAIRTETNKRRTLERKKGH